MRSTLSIVLLSAVLVMPALAVIPENDSFATRITLVGTNVSTSGNNADATKEIDEPDPSFQGGKSVWWTWTAPSNGYVMLSTAGSSFDTMLTVCTGTSVSNLTLVAFNDTETNTSSVSFNVFAGTAYQIAVDGAQNTTGSISLQLSLGPPQPPPANDDFADRITIVGTHLSNVPGSNLGATAEPGEPFHADTIGLKSVWWSWTAPDSGGVTISSQGSLIDTVIGVYTGNSVGNLTLVAGNDEDPLSSFGYESRATFNAVSNVTYQIAVDGYEGDSGDIRLRLDLDSAFPVPTNDNFANRKVISGNNINTNGSNVGASFEVNEPMHMLTFGGKSVWYSWTAPSSGGVTLSASNNFLDTIVAVYRGTSLANLTFVAGNDEDFVTAPEGDSTVYFNATNGVTYQIAVDGFDGSSGNFNLRLELGALDPAPANDNFANRIVITGTNTTRTGSNIGATLEANEPLHRGYYGGKSVWYRWTSPAAGFVTVDTIGSLCDTLLAVYTGTALSNLVEVASDDESGGNYTSLVWFPCKSNVTYQIAIDGFDNDGYDVTTRVRFTPASYSLTVTTNPAGAGTVTSNPLPDQGNNYAPGSVVTLTATPAAGSVFTGWTGNMVSTNTSVVLMMNSNKSVTANFFVIPTTKVWTGASNPSGNWSAAQNWNGSLPVAGDQLVFPPGAARLSSNTNDFPANTIFKSIVVGGVDYVLRGNAVSLTNGIICTNTTGTNTISLNVQLNSDQSFRCEQSAARLIVSGNIALGNRTLTAETIGNLTLSGVISGTGGLIKTNAGTLSLLGSNPNTYSGATVVNQGTLLLGKSGVAIAGTLTIGDGTGAAGSDLVQFTANSQLSNSSVTVNSSGRLDLNGFSGAVASLVLNGGNVRSGAGTLSLNSNVTANASSTSATVEGNLSLQNATRTFTVADGAAADDLEILAIIGDGGGGAGMIKTGPGTLRLSGANTYVGSTTINQGVLSVANSAALGATNAGTIVNSNTVLLLAASNNAEPLTLAGGRIDSLSGSNLWSGPVTLSNTSVLLIASNAALNLSAVIGGNGGMIKDGNGHLILSGAANNTYTGLTTVKQGRLVLSKSTSNAIPGTLLIGDGSGGNDADVVTLKGQQQISTGSAITIANSGLLEIEAVTDAIGSLVGNGHVSFTDAAANLQIGANSSSSVFDGTITGPGGLTKLGAGSFTLNATNGYTGPTSVGEGVLSVNGWQPGSSITIGALGVLAGTGRVGKISGSGTISPGSSPGILRGSNLTVSSNMTYQVELNGPLAGSGYDQIAVSGSVTLAGSLNVFLGFFPSPEASFTIIDNDGTDPVNGTFAGLPQDSLLTFGDLSLQISYVGGSDSNDVTLTYIVPSAPIIGALELLTNGAVQFQGAGVAGFSYVLEAANSLEPPVQWNPISTNTAGPGGELSFTDPDAYLFDKRFYRIRR